MTALGSHTSTKRLSLRPPSLGAALLRTCSRQPGSSLPLLQFTPPKARLGGGDDEHEE